MIGSHIHEKKENILHLFDLFEIFFK